MRDVMTPRTVTFSLDETNTVKDAMKLQTQLSSHSRIPIYAKEINEVSGIIMRKDVLLAAAESQHAPDESRELQSDQEDDCSALHPISCHR